MKYLNVFVSKRICFVVSTIVFCFFFIEYGFAQGPSINEPGTHRAKQFEISINYPGMLNNSVGEFNYFARDYVHNSPFYHFKAETGLSYHAKIDPNIIINTEYVAESTLVNPNQRVIDVNLPVGSISGESNVLPNGAFTYNIPITVTPGTNGLQPNLSLIYSSQAGNGIAGYGWNITGISAITRSGLDLFKDGDISQFENKYDDKLAYDGNRLVAIEGDYGGPSTVYGTEIGNTTRVFPQGSYNSETGYDWFKVITKDGTIYEYGNINNLSNSKFVVSYVVNGVSKTCVVAWKLNRVIDKFGNYMDFYYDTYEGEHALKSIKYTGNLNTNMAPYASVNFLYQKRGDIQKKYLAIKNTSNNTNTYSSQPIYNNSNACVIQSLLLRRIESAYESSVIRKYDFKYTGSISEIPPPIITTGTNSNNSLLVEIYETGENNERTNSTIFTYTKKVAENELLHATPISSANNPSSNRQEDILGDFDGDGITDRIQIARHKGVDNNQALWYLQKGHWFEYPGVGSYGFVGNQLALTTTDSVPNDDMFFLKQVLVIDLDNDGQDEMILPVGSDYHEVCGPYIHDYWNTVTYYVYKYNSLSTSFEVKASFEQSTHQTINNSPCDGARIFYLQSILPGDFDGDGLIDLFIVSHRLEDNISTKDNYKNYMTVKLFNSDGTYKTEPELSVSVPFLDVNQDAQAFALNSNINRKTDVFLTSSWPFFNSQINESLHFELNPDNGLLQVVGGVTKFPCDWEYQYGDLNGDRLPDMIYRKISDNVNSAVYYRYNTGVGFSDEMKLSEMPHNSDDFDNYNKARNQIKVGDFNGDGLADILIISYYSEMVETIFPCDEIIFSVFYSKGFDRFENRIYKARSSQLTDLNPSMPCTDNTVLILPFIAQNWYFRLDAWNFHILREMFNFQVVDFNGDGIAELYNPNSPNGSIISFYTSNRPQQLVSISDGFGNRTDVKYSSISKPGNTYSYDETNVAYPYRVLKNGAEVVSQINKYEYRPNESVKNKFLQEFRYLYKTGIVHKDKGFLGFQEFATQYDLETENEIITSEDRTFAKVLLPRPNIILFENWKGQKNIINSSGTQTISEATTEYTYSFYYNYNVWFPNTSTIRSENKLTNTYNTTVLTYDDKQNTIEKQVRHGIISNPDNGSFDIETIEEYFYAPPCVGSVFWADSSCLVGSAYTSSHSDEPAHFYSRRTHYEYEPSSYGNRWVPKKVIKDRRVSINLNPLRVETESEYDLYGNVIRTDLKQFDDPNLSDRTVLKQFDSKGRFQTIESNSLGYTKYMSTNPQNGLVRSSTDFDSKVTRFEFDGLGRSTKVIYPTGQNVQTSLSWASLTDPVGTAYKKKVVYDDAPDVTIYYNSLGRELRSEKESFGNGLTYVDKEYYIDGRVRSETLPYFSSASPTYKTVTYYDNLGRLSSVIMENVGGASANILLTETTYGSVANGDPRTITVKDGFGKVTMKETDAAGNLVSSADGFINSSGVYEEENRVDFQYGANLKVLRTITKAIDGNTDFISTNEYDIYAQLIKVTNPDAGAHEYKYNAFGEMVEELTKTVEATPTEPAHNYYESIQFDEIGRVINKKLKKATTVAPIITTELESTTFEYVPANTNGANRLSRIRKRKASDPANVFMQTIEHTYDSYGRDIKTIETVEGKPFTTEFEFNGKGQLLSQKYPTNVKIQFSYDPILGFNTSISRVDVAPAEEIWRMVEVDPMGNVIKYVMADGTIHTDKGYDALKYPTTLNTYTAAGSIVNMTYEFDHNSGLLMSRADISENSQIEQFTYDKLRRLTGFTVTKAGYTPKTTTMNYNLDGTMAEKSDVGSYNYKELVGNSNIVTKPYHAPKTIQTPTNQLEPPSLLATEYNGYRMIEAISADGKRTDFVYGFDESRMRVRHTPDVGSPNNYYDKYYVGGCEFYEYFGTNPKEKSVTYISTKNGLTAVVVKETSQAELTLYVHKDYLGSIVALSKKTGPASAIRYAGFNYDPWGKMRNVDNWLSYYSSDMDVPGFDIIERGFTGHEHIRQFGLINMNARLYDPRIASFLSPDNLLTDPNNPQNYNRYSYALNNPLVYTDPSGNSLEAVLFAAAFVTNLAQVAHTWGMYGTDAGMRSLVTTGAMAIMSMGITYGLNCVLPAGPYHSLGVSMGSNTINFLVSGAINGKLNFSDLGTSTLLSMFNLGLEVLIEKNNSVTTKPVTWDQMSDKIKKTIWGIFSENYITYEGGVWYFSETEVFYYKFTKEGIDYEGLKIVKHPKMPVEEVIKEKGYVRESGKGSTEYVNISEKDIQGVEYSTHFHNHSEGYWMQYNGNAYYSKVSKIDYDRNAGIGKNQGQLSAMKFDKFEVPSRWDKGDNPNTNYYIWITDKKPPKLIQYRNNKEINTIELK